MEFYAKHDRDRDKFEIVAFHEDSAKTFKELDEKLKPIINGVWKGRSLPFPIVLDATGETVSTNYGVTGFPTVVLIDPAGNLVKGHAESLLEQVLASEKYSGFPAAASPDGLRIATGVEHSVTVRDSTSDQETVTFRGHKDTVNGVAFSPDGKSVASAGRDKVIKVWDVTTGKITASIKGHTATIFALAFSPDGKTLASAGFDQLRRWNITTAKEMHLPEARHIPVWSVAFSPDGNSVAAGGLGGIYLWNAATGQRVNAFKGGPALVRALAFSPDGRTLAAQEDNSIALWDTGSGQKRAKHSSHLSDVAYLKFQDNILVSVSRAKTMKFWEITRTNDLATPPDPLERNTAGLTARLPDAAEPLSDECWNIVSEKGRDSSAYRRALEQARTAARLDPTNLVYLQNLGIALYRNGNYSEAIPLLIRSSVVPPKTRYTRPLPPSLVFLALAYHKSGETQAAADTALRVRGLLLTWRSAPGGIVEEMDFELYGPGANDGRLHLTRLFAKHPTKEAVLSSIETDASLAPEIRQAVIKLAPSVEAEKVVRELQSKFLLRTRISNEVAHLPGLSESTRHLALVLTADLEERASDLNAASWKTVSKPGLDAAAYEHALAQAEAAVRLDPDPGHLNTLGVARYRAGRYSEALKALIRSQKLNPRGPNTPADVAFIALSHQRLGQFDPAQKTLARLRKSAKEFANDPESMGFLREAEALIEAKATAGQPSN